MNCAMFIVKKSLSALSNEAIRFHTKQKQQIVSAVRRRKNRKNTLLTHINDLFMNATKKNQTDEEKGSGLSLRGAILTDRK